MRERPFTDGSILSLLRAIGEALIVLDADGRPAHWNAAAERLLGLGDVEPGGAWSNRPKMFTPDRHPVAVEDRPLARALRGEDVDESEFFLHAEGGPWTLVRGTARPLRDDAGAVVGAVCIMREITEQRRLEVARRESDQLYRTLVRHLPSTTVFLFDRQMRFLLAEGAALEQLGFTRGQIEGHRVADVVSPHLLAKFEAALAGVYTSMETERSGHAFRLQVVPIRDDAGAVTGGLVVSHDVTDDRVAAAHLREAEEQLRLAIEHAPIGMAVSRLDGRFVRVNQALCALLGYTPDELLERTSQSLTHTEDRRMELDGLHALLSGDVTRYRIEKRWVRKDGSYAPTMVHGSIVRDAANAPINVITQIEDLSERKQLEGRLRTNDRMASIGTLAGGVAHEINNPLAYVTTNLDLVAEELRELGGAVAAGRLVELTRMVDAAREGAERVRTIVRGLKTFSRGDEERRIVLEVPPVLELAINMALHEIRPRAQLLREYGPIPAVEADEARLAQVFINLLLNAAQAIPAGEADQHQIRVITRTDESGRAVVEVQDTGAGIAPADLERIFDPFFTTKAVGAGTGLGLAICHGIVTDLGGQIDVESVVCMGTMFRVTLPAASTKQTAIAEAPVPKATTEARGRVLVVDDEPAIASAIRRTLRDQDVVSVVSGKLALECLDREAPFDAIICDLMMPGMTGMELFGELSSRWPHLADRVVFLTGGAFTPAARQFLDRVPNQRLDKPFDPRNLRALIRSFMRPVA